MVGNKAFRSATDAAAHIRAPGPRLCNLLSSIGGGRGSHAGRKPSSGSRQPGGGPDHVRQRYGGPP
jgi:hypothetical protein